jgi:hemerythrin
MRFPELPAHKAEHEAITRKVQVFRQEYAGGRAALDGEILTFLKNWLIEHIGTRDVPAGAWLNG